MHIVKTKNEFSLSIYLVLSVITTGYFLFISQNLMEIFAIIICYAATFVNHYLLYYSVKEFLNPYYIEHPERKPNKRIILAVIAKFVVLVLAFVVAARMMDKRVLLPVLNYVLMIFVLVFSASYKVTK